MELVNDVFEYSDVQLLAHCLHEMRELNQKILSDHGLNWDTFKELKQRIADTAVGAIETEYGTLDIAEEPFYLHKNSEPLGNRKTIRLRRTN